MASIKFFRIKPEHRDPDQIVVDRESPQVYYSPVRVGDEIVGHLYVRRFERHRPSWLTYIQPHVDLSGVTLRTASLAGVMLIPRPEAMYAVIFGYGASLLAEGVVEPRFGLLATLNAIEPSSLRSVDHKRLEATSRHTREQLTREGGLDQFGIDTNRDLLRAVTGKPTDPVFGRRLTGADLLAVSADISLPELPEKLSLYGELAGRTSYRTTFPWVDNISDVHDPVLIAELDRRLAAELALPSHNFWLAPPGLIDWADLRGFAYSTRKSSTVYDDLSLEDYFREYGSVADLAGGQRLAQDKIFYLRQESDTARHYWPALNCLVGEIAHGGDRFVLNEGTWYRIDSAFYADLDTEIARMPRTAADLPDYDHADEARYNTHAYERNRRTMALLDRQFVTLPKRGPIEVCDLYAKDRIFVHVKRYSGSAPLSHLFNQGLVSAELFRAEPQFRRDFLAMIPSFAWPDAAAAIKPSDFEVAYAVICKPGQTLHLPFFSKVSLRNVTRTLSDMGFRVTLTGIPSHR